MRHRKLIRVSIICLQLLRAEAILLVVVALVSRCALMLALVCGASPLRASAGWPIFRGNPALTGVSTELLPSTLEILWSFKTGAPVKSSAVIGGGRAFIGSNDGRVHALDMATGHEVWMFDAGSAVEAPPMLSGNAVYAGTIEGMFYSINAANGQTNWKYSTEGKILGSANMVPGPDGTPRILVGSYDFKLYCLDAASGKPAWTYETGNYINGSCAVAGGQIVFGGCDAMLHVLAATNGARIKEIDTGAPIAASARHCPEIGLILAITKTNFSASISAKRVKVAWRYHELDFPFMASAAVTADRVVFGGFDKALHCVSPADGKSLWKFPTRGKIESSPVIADGKVVFGSDDGTVYMVSLKEGKQLWSYQIGQAVVSSPAVADEKIVIGSDDGSVYCFGQKR